MNIKETLTSDLHVYSQRLFTYYDELHKQLQNIDQNGSRISGYPLEELKDKISKEAASVSGALQMIHEEIEKRMTEDIGLKLETVEIFEEISTLYSLLNDSIRSENQTEKKSNLKLHS